MDSAQKNNVDSSIWNYYDIMDRKRKLAKCRINKCGRVITYMGSMGTLSPLYHHLRFGHGFDIPKLLVESYDEGIVCRYCHRTFKNGTKRKKHELIHTMDKPFPCNVCDKSFTRKTNMKIHVKKFHITPTENANPPSNAIGYAAAGSNTTGSDVTGNDTTAGSAIEASSSNRASKEPKRASNAASNGLGAYWEMRKYKPVGEWWEGCPYCSLKLKTYYGFLTHRTRCPKKPDDNTNPRRKCDKKYPRKRPVNVQQVDEDDGGQGVGQGGGDCVGQQEGQGSGDQLIGGNHAQGSFAGDNARAGDSSSGGGEYGGPPRSVDDYGGDYGGACGSQLGGQGGGDPWIGGNQPQGILGGDNACVGDFGSSGGGYSRPPRIGGSYDDGQDGGANGQQGGQGGGDPRNQVDNPAQGSFGSDYGSGDSGSGGGQQHQPPTPQQQLLAQLVGHMRRTGNFREQVNVAGSATESVPRNPTESANLGGVGYDGDGDPGNQGGNQAEGSFGGDFGGGPTDILTTNFAPLPVDDVDVEMSADAEVIDRGINDCETQ